MPRSSTPRTPKPQNAQTFTRKLLAWYARAARDLPWRRTRNPYRVLVSEFMLQQTQVDRVRAFYPRFLARFPDLTTLAAARPRAVREAWEGLGYYARAHNLHALAKCVTGRPDGSLPKDPEELLALPGVGPYTAGAVACFAFEQPVPAVDTNVARVIRRVFFGYLESGKRGARPGAADRLPRRAAPPGPRAIHELARVLVPRQGKQAWRFNQALMELGALVCTARKPRCPECPVRAVCRTGRRLAADQRRRGHRQEAKSAGD
jgi:A/G-specific adenine glycosylase